MRRPEPRTFRHTNKLKALISAGLFIFLLAPATADEYRWPAPVPDAARAPTDSVGAVIRGASLQGGLIDLRYGQASIDLGGEGVLLDWNDSTVFTLNGEATTATALTEYLIERGGLVVAVRYNPESGLMGWCDAVHSGPTSAVDVKLQPWKPLYQPGEKIVVSISRSESERLKLKNPTLFAPGMYHDLALQPRKQGGWKAVLPVLNGWNWKGLPLFVKTEPGSIYRGKALSVTSSSPRIGDCGPTVASEWLETIPGWFELEGNQMFLDPASITVTTSAGARVVELYPRPGRVDFLMKVDGAGTYQIEAKVADTTGKESKKVWSFTVRR